MVDLERESPGGVSVRPRAASPRWAVALCCLVGALALGLALYPLTLPDALSGVHPNPSGYDDGVYVGAAIRLIHGVLPYRDYLFLQPPGIVVLMSPAALVGQLVNTDVALVTARLLTALVTGANALLVALILRPRGRLAMIVGGGALALFPLSAAASAQDELEPYVILLLLLAVLVGLSRPRPSTRRLIVAGALAGFAVATKLPVVLPSALLSLSFAPDWRRARAVAKGALAGFVLPCLFFFGWAPRSALREVFLDQLTRHDAGAFSLGERLVMIFGIGGAGAAPGRAGAAVALSVLFAVVTGAAYLLNRSGLGRLEWYILAASLVVLGELLAAHEFYDHYAYLTAALLALLLGTVLSRVAEGIGRRRGQLNGARWRVIGAELLLGSASLVAVGFGLPHVLAFERGYVNNSFNPAKPIDAAIAPGLCVTSDQVSLTIVANRFVPSRRGCPAVIDAYGMFIANDLGHPPPGVPPPQSFVSQWYFDFVRSRAVVMRAPIDPYIAWNDALIDYFNLKYQLVSQTPGAAVYLHVPNRRA